jgi:hypothetical protein
MVVPRSIARDNTHAELMTGKSSVSFQALVPLWVRRRTASIEDSEPASLYAAGTGSAVTDLIFSIAKREVTFFSGTVAISFL